MVPVIAGHGLAVAGSRRTGYLPGVLGPMILFGVGMGLAFVPLTTAALAGVRAEDSGAASSMVNVTQQVGGALGLAILVTVFGAASRAPAGRPARPEAPSWPARMSIWCTAWRARSPSPPSSTCAPCW